jgi:tetratricopeptide (TPR) repeat protein
MRRLGAAAGLLGLSLFAARSSPARPTFWERARDPDAAVESALLARLEFFLIEQATAGHDPSYFQHFARAGVAAIELSRVRQPKDLRLACAMGRILIDAGVDREAEAEALFVRALPNLPPGSLATGAWLELGIARALRADYAGAREAETAALDLAVEPATRARALSLRAASNARVGDLRRAEHDYRAAASFGGDPVSQALAFFGLGVTLERLGDVPAAQATFDTGLLVRLPLAHFETDDPLDLPGLDFFPRYERFYLTALVAMARARHDDDAHARRADYEAALEEWDAYLLAADAAEPWLEHARRHREFCAGELRKLPARHRHQKN